MAARPRPFLALGIVAIFVAACASSTSPSPAASPAPSATPIADASPSASPTSASQPESEPSAPVTPGEPSAAPSATPTPAPALWSTARAVKGLEGCSNVVATVDDGGTSHLAASCGNSAGQIRYASSADGHAWTTTTFKTPAGRFEQDPELAFAGSTLYLSYTRVAPAGEGCGDDGLVDVGVYVRTRTLPDGSWSAPLRIGAVADHLQAFRVRGTDLHATVTNEKTDGTFYELVSGGTTQRVRVGEAAGWTALRIGDDGTPRLALEGAAGIRFGQVAGGKLSASTIPGTARGSGPVMALGPGNVAYVLWNRSAVTGGCIDGNPDPAAGTYLSTNAGGSWATTRLSKRVGAASITMDPASGQVDALVGDLDMLQLFERSADGAWTHQTLATQFASSAVVRRNPSTGGLLVAYVQETLDGDIPASESK